MALDDGAEIDPATLPDSLELLQQLEAPSDPALPPLSAPALGDMRELVIEASQLAIDALQDALQARKADHPLEEDLRTALALAFARTDAAVLTEAKLRLKGWTPNLGGFDLAVAGTDGSLILLETKLGNVWQGIWDVLKLASGHQHPRVTAAYAAYAATPHEWAKYEERELFVSETRVSVTEFLLEEYETEWAWNLKGSPTVRPTILPAGVAIRRVHTKSVTLLGKEYEVRVVSVTATQGPLLKLPQEMPPLSG